MFWTEERVFLLLTPKHFLGRQAFTMIKRHESTAFSTMWGSVQTKKAASKFIKSDRLSCYLDNHWRFRCGSLGFIEDRGPRAASVFPVQSRRSKDCPVESEFGDQPTLAKKQGNQLPSALLVLSLDRVLVTDKMKGGFSPVAPLLHLKQAQGGVLQCRPWGHFS